jgi:hypothetical protein
MSDTTLLVLTGATALNGILAGASLDQSIKQLPARHRIGPVAYSTYSRASDLGNGILWYASIGISAALLSVAVAVVAYVQRLSIVQALPIYSAAVLSILHSFITARAAPTNFSQRNYENDVPRLALIFDRFARLQALRAFVQVVTFGMLLWALVNYSH